LSPFAQSQYKSAAVVSFEQGAVDAVSWQPGSGLIDGLLRNVAIL
jgi:hypothetical protein